MVSAFVTEEDYAKLEEVRAYRKWGWDNPVSWIRTCLGVRLYSKQREVVRSVRHNRRTSVRSAHGVGKTETAACAALWYLNVVCPSRIVLTSVTWDHLKDILWSSIHRLIHNAPFDVTLGGNLLDTELEVIDGWGIYGLSPNNPDAFGGYHSENGVFVAADEASALQRDHAVAINGIITTEMSRILYIGNPTIAEGEFFESFEKPGWNNIHISAYDCPNVIAGRSVVPGLSDRVWVEDQKREWGEDSPDFKVRVKGEFKDSSEDSLVKRSWIKEAIERKASGSLGRRKLGVDVARQGSDRTVFLIRDDQAVRHIEYFVGQDLMATAGKTKALAEKHGIDPDCVYVDDSGLGGGVTDRLREQNFNVIPVQNGAKAQDKKHFLNVRSESYWRVRKALDPDGDFLLSLSKEHENLGKELIATHYTHNSAGQIKIEEKEEIKKRIKCSPDMADALALTFASRGIAAEIRDLDLGFE